MKRLLMAVMAGAAVLALATVSGCGSAPARPRCRFLSRTGVTRSRGSL